MSLKIKVPCKSETHIVNLWAGDDPDAYRDVELEIPEHDDLELEYIAVELGDEPSECVRLKDLADQGFYHLLGDPKFIVYFFEALDERGAEPEDLNPKYFNIHHLGQRIADFFRYELMGDEHSVASEYASSLIETINHFLPEALETQEFQDEIVELAQLAYESEDFNFIKELNGISKKPFYSLDIDELKDLENYPGFRKTIYQFSFKIGGDEMNKWGLCIAGYYEIPEMEWVTEVCDHDDADYKTVEFLDALDEDTDFEEQIILQPGWWLPTPDGSGEYSVWVDGDIDSVFEGESEARTYFDMMCSSADYQSREHAGSWEIKLKQLFDKFPEDDGVFDPEDEENWETIDSY